MLLALMAESVSRRPLTAEARVRSQVSPWQFCNGQSNTGTGFSSSNSVFPCQGHSTNVLGWISLFLYFAMFWIRGSTRVVLPSFRGLLSCLLVDSGIKPFSELSFHPSSHLMEPNHLILHTSSAMLNTQSQSATINNFTFLKWACQYAYNDVICINSQNCCFRSYSTIDPMTLLQAYCVINTRKCYVSSFWITLYSVLVWLFACSQPTALSTSMQLRHFLTAVWVWPLLDTNGRRLRTLSCRPLCFVLS
jgi:hypothetical protein